MKYFTVEELTKSDTAKSNNIDNTPSIGVVANLVELIENVLDPTREKLQKPIRVNCGYRCKALNDKVGGAKNSQHLTGQAADIVSNDNLQLAKVIFENGIFDQLILEYPQNGQPSWVHVSYSKGKNRKQVLKCVRENGKAKYLPYSFGK